MKRLLIITGLTLGLLLGVAIGPAGADSTLSRYNAMYTTYKQIDAALGSSTSTSASVEALFVKYSNEAVAFAADDTTRSKLINADIEAYALAGNKWAWVGYQTVASNTSNMGPWKAAVKAFAAATTKFTNDLKKEN